MMDSGRKGSKTKQPRQQPAANSPGWLSTNPMALFGAAVVLAQLIIFNVGLRFFHQSSMISESSEMASAHAASLKKFQKQGKRTRRTAKRKIADDPNGDGTFNGFPIYFKEDKANIQTLPHCVGENYQEGESWKHRSCHFQFFCFDTTTKDYVVYEAPEEEKIYSLLEKHPLTDISQSYLKQNHTQSNTMSLGGINLKWGVKKGEGLQRLEWFPEIRKLSPEEPLSYYELNSNVVMIPFHSMNGANPGHLVWDDFLPIYTLLTMFQLSLDSDLLMMRYVLKDGRGLWASCDFKDEKTAACKKMHKKFLPLMMGPDSTQEIRTTEDFAFVPKGNAKSTLICAKNGAAGIGSLTDHGPHKLHGWEQGDYEITHNHGRGGMLYDFRNFMMSNIGIPTEYSHIPPFRIVFSEKSSDIPTRDIDFSRQKDILRQNFNPEYVSIEGHVFKDIPLAEQVEIASQTTIYISGVGGGAVTSMFMPRGSSVFLYYLENGGVELGRATGKPARLDWDLFNNLGYLKVHWLPKRQMDSEEDLRSLVLLVQHELDALMRERSYDKFFY